MKTVIEVKNISKKYQIHPEGRPYKLLQKDILRKIKQPFELFRKDKKEEFWALRNISFTVKKGEIIGIIGKNGSGKSTLLKILGQITPPSEGQAIIRGKVSSLLEAGPGFHQELTGRENVFLNGIILGIPKKIIERKYNEIVEFSGIEKFIDIPVKFYSSGMYVRLAFSISVHLLPEIFLLDEILSVGDAEFQQKSMEKVKELVQNKNSSVILVSHNLQSVRELCQRVILLDEGKVKKIGKPETVIENYLKNNHV